MVDHINNGEEGFSVREKLNTVIDRTNTLNGIENQVESNKNLSQQNKARIDKEIQDRIAGDNALDARVDKEIADRKAADQANKNQSDDRIDQEIADRTEADGVLQDQIDALVLDSQSDVNSVNGMTGNVVLDHTDVGAAKDDHNHDGVYQPVGDYATSAELSAEESARIAADNAEEQARIAGDADLQDQIDNLEEAVIGDGGFVDAPDDGQQYARQSVEGNMDWTPVSEGVWSRNGDDIYYNDGKVGIGMTPNRSTAKEQLEEGTRVAGDALQVTGDSHFQGRMRVSGGKIEATAIHRHQEGSGGFLFDTNGYVRPIDHEGNDWDSDGTDGVSIGNNWKRFHAAYFAGTVDAGTVVAGAVEAGTVDTGNISASGTLEFGVSGINAPDANTAKKPGFYSTADLATVTNWPDGSGMGSGPGALQTFPANNANNAVQFAYGLNNQKVFFRSYRSSSWKDWREFVIADVDGSLDHTGKVSISINENGGQTLTVKNSNATASHGVKVIHGGAGVGTFPILCETTGGEETFRVDGAGNVNIAGDVGSQGNVDVGADPGATGIRLYASGSAYVRMASASASELFRGYGGDTKTSSITSNGAAFFNGYSTSYGFKVGNARIYDSRAGGIGLYLDGGTDAILPIDNTGNLKSAGPSLGNGSRKFADAFFTGTVEGKEFLTKNVNYSSNQDKAYMIAGTTSYTGANTNWGTSGFQHRVKSDGNGSSRVTIDVGGAEVHSVNTGGTVTATNFRAATNNYFISRGEGGWTNETHGGGWNMTDSTWVRSINFKAVYVANSGASAIATAGDVVAYYSDKRLKDVKGQIENPLDKVDAIETFYYSHNDLAKELGYEGDEVQVGVSAQSVKEVMPEVVCRAPVDMDADGGSLTGEDYMTVKYERLVPLLLESIKELRKEIEELKRG